MLILSCIVFIFLGGLFIGINFQHFGLNKTNDMMSDDNMPKITENSDIQENLLNSISDIPTPFQKSVTHNELMAFALDKINQDRLEHNLAPLELGDNLAAQSHATDMFEVNYFSHWNSMGVKPYVNYSLNGGRNYVQENIAVSWCEGLVCKLDPFKQIEKLQYSMVYDDASSNWGHRDAILNPHATHVNFGISYDDHNFYFVQHFETNLINWNEFKLNHNGELIISGTMANNYEIHSLTIFEDPKMKIISSDELKTKKPYIDKSYDQGKFVGILVKTPPILSFYEECAPKKITVSSDDNILCIDYETYDLYSESGNIQISTNVSNWLNDDNLKTLYINLIDDNDEVISASSVTLNFLLDS